LARNREEIIQQAREALSRVESFDSTKVPAYYVTEIRSSLAKVLGLADQIAELNKKLDVLFKVKDGGLFASSEAEPPPAE